ncbi:MAG: hypothetical protein AB8G05_15615 [Oligoflexales bacterium]
MRYLILVFVSLFEFGALAKSNNFQEWKQLMPSYQLDAIGNCEFIDTKDFNEDLIHTYPKIDFTIDPSVLQTGKVQFGYEILNSDEFAQKIPIDTLVRNPAFEKGMIIVQKGAFVVDKKNKIFYRPEYQLAEEVVETIGRKVKVISKPSKYHTHAQKHVKHSLRFLPQIYLDVHFRAYQYSFRKQRFRGDLNQIVPLDQLTSLANQFLNGHNELIPQYLFGVYGDGDHKILHGISFLSISYAISNSEKKLILTWQLSSIRSNFIIKSALKIIPGLVQKTVMRDFARYVDVMRSLNPPKGWTLK